jgi:predicted anti-sigma-YlaC factor YlaD
MTCHDAAPLLSPSLDDALSATQDVELRQHVDRCDMCRSRLNRLRAARDAFRLAAPRERSTPERTPTMPPPAAAAAALLAIAMLLLAFVLRGPAPTSDVTTDLLLMPFESTHAHQPCFYASDCGIGSEAQLP